MAAEELTVPFDDDCILEINTENLIDLEDKTVELKAHRYCNPAGIAISMVKRPKWHYF